MYSTILNILEHQDWYIGALHMCANRVEKGEQPKVVVTDQISGKSACYGLWPH